MINDPAAWRALLPLATDDTHKYSRGHVAVVSGGPFATGAARLAAHAAARSGAGAVTLMSPPSAAQVNATRLTSIMLAPFDGAEEAVRVARERKVGCVIAGPGGGVGETLRELCIALLQPVVRQRCALVLDADALTTFALTPGALFDAIAQPGRPVVPTPHAGEFGRLFPDLTGDGSKLERTREAARRSAAVIVHKGSDTVIAAPDGRAAVNVNGTPHLATAGSGDTLCGIVAALLAGGMQGWEAACAAVWIHAEAGRMLGAGLIAEDLADALPRVSLGRRSI